MSWKGRRTRLCTRGGGTVAQSELTKAICTVNTHSTARGKYVVVPVTYCTRRLPSCGCVRTVVRTYLIVGQILLLTADNLSADRRRRQRPALNRPKSPFSASPLNDTPRIARLGRQDESWNTDHRGLSTDPETGYYCYTVLLISSVYCIVCTVYAYICLTTFAYEPRRYREWPR